MRTRRVAALVLALASLAPACGSGNDAESDRIVSSPLATVSPDVSTPSPRAEATSGVGAEETPRSTTGSETRRRSTPRPTSAPVLAEARVKLTKVASIDDPVAMAIRKGDSAIYVAQRHPGTVRPVRRGRVGSPILDIGDEISTGNEQGLLSLTFSPDGKKLYVWFTSQRGSGAAGDDVLREYDFVDGRATSPRDLLRVADPFGNHNGGTVVFGPDGHLYVSIGDGGSANDPTGNAQNLNQLLGKLLRIDPEPSGSRPYSIPADNPFVGRDGRDEIWAYGLRNPWRISFDRRTGDLWIGDVGQNQWEEVDFAPAGGDGGDNYGWDRMEGTHRFEGSPPSNHHGPIYEYNHDQGCSVTGGFVYRGSKIHDLQGAFVFADFCAGMLRAFVREGNDATGHRFLGPKLGQLASFGESSNGEIYVMSLGGGLYRIDPA